MALTERKSRLFLFGKVLNKRASEARRVIEGPLTPIKEFVQTITGDNGKEFSYHVGVSATLEEHAFFAPLRVIAAERELQWPSYQYSPAEFKQFLIDVNISIFKELDIHLVFDNSATH